MRGGAPGTSCSASQPGIAGGGVLRGRPALLHNLSTSVGQTSKTSRRTGPCGRFSQTRWPVATSMSKARCTSQGALGERPAMNQVGRRCGQSGPGSCPLSAQTSTLIIAGGRGPMGDGSLRSWATSASTTEKKSGAAVLMPTNSGLLRPAKSPTQTTSTYGPTSPALQASRKPQDVPVFHGRTRLASAVGRLGEMGRGFLASMSSTSQDASVESNGTFAAGVSPLRWRRGRSAPWLASTA